MDYLARPAVAIAFGAFFLCAETCLHAEELSRFASRPTDLPVYDWLAGGFLLVAGLLSLRQSSTRRRQYQAVAWGFMLSLLVGATWSILSDWLTPPDETGWLSEGGFLIAVVTMTIIAACALTSTLRALESR